MLASIRSATGAPHTRILGVGAYRPARVVTNEEVCQHIDSSDEWIRTRSGIVTRRWAGPSETLLAMAVAAAGKALAESGISPDQIGCVLVATSTRLEQTPAIAPRIAYELGAGNPAAFDITNGCAGFCYGLALASDIVRGGSAEYVLLIGVERLSDCLDLSDRTSAFIFGDGAGAVVVGPSDRPAIGPVVWGSDGSHANLAGQTRTYDQLRDDPTGPFPALFLRGIEVFRWASYQMIPVALEALEKAGVSIGDLDAFIPHQANQRITEVMTRALKLPAHIPVANDIVDMGNTSAASIPLAIERMLGAGEVASGGTALLIAFGAGLAYAAQVITLP
jgi:3-oxoacyl-[acyl-carrier-protein] synthase III